jgi:hypothetical protein
MLRSAFGIATLAGLFVLAPSGLLPAAEMAVPEEAPVAMGPPSQDCGPCGCLQVTYVYHRDLRSTYGLGFDPRSYDQTEPHYFLGPIRPYPQYFVDGIPVGGRSC